MMNSAFEQLLAHMSQMQTGYWANRQQQAVCIDFPGIVGSFRVIVQISESGDELYVFGQTRLHVEPGCRAAVAETIERANYGLTYGALELNDEAHELRFHAAESFAVDELDGAVVERLIDASRATLDTYLRAILSVIFGNELPEDALRLALAAQG